MATATGKNRCVICNKENASLKCEGCSRTFCYNHLNNHREELNQQLDKIEVTRDLLQQSINSQTAEPQRQLLFRQIDEWERNSINKIRQTADKARQLLLRQTTRHVNRVKTELDKLTDKLRHNRQENDFVETDLKNWMDELTRLTNELYTRLLTIRQDSKLLTTKILFDVPTLLYIPNINANANWIQNGVTIAGGNGNDSKLNQFSNPDGIYLDDHHTIYVADWSNNRIMKWKNGATSGQVVAGGNGRGNQPNQLNGPTTVIVDKTNDSLIISDCRNRRVMRWPRRNGINGEIIISDVVSFGLTMDSYGHLYVCDYDKHEVKRWKIGDTNGTVVAGGNGPGHRLDQLYHPTNIFIDEKHSLYISDYSNHRVIKWVEDAKEGVVVAGGQGAGNKLTQLNYPRGIVVDQLNTIYVADHYNSRVMRWPKDATEGSVIVGENDGGAQPNQLDSCLDLLFDRQGNLYISDNGNHRVQKFNIDTNSLE